MTSRKLPLRETVPRFSLLAPPLGLTALAAWLLVLMEWLFFVTKPSFLSSMTWSDRLIALSAGASVPLIFGLLSLVVCAFLSLSFGIKKGRKEIFFFLSTGVPAVLLSTTILLAIDNFTNTVLLFGIRDAHGMVRFAYATGLLLILAICWRCLWFSSRSSWWINNGYLTFGCLASLSLIGALVGHTTVPGQLARITSELRSTPKMPNVLIIGSDGIEARHLSLYGYSSETTPFLEDFSQNAIVAYNAFTNAAHTGASLVSMLTGKLPTETRLIYPPDVLSGYHSYQSLPALLRARGYRCFQSSLRYYADAVDLNLRAAFDYANGRTIERFSGRLADLVGHPPTLLVQFSWQRVTERVHHILGIREIIDPYKEVMKLDGAYGVSDEQRIRDFLDFVDRSESNAPFFAQIHLMGTHGARFYPPERFFSENMTQDEDWMTAFYDDSILWFDTLLGRLMGELEARGISEETLVVIYSDHGMRYKTDSRLPLIIRVPGGARVHRIKTNVQNLDIPSTILSLLGIEAPGWMEGVSLLEAEPEPCRNIFSAIVNSRIMVHRDNYWKTLPEPPFYSLGSVGLIVCDTYFRYDVIEDEIEVRRIRDYVGSCGGCSMATEDARRLILTHLVESGYSQEE